MSPALVANCIEFNEQYQANDYAIGIPASEQLRYPDLMTAARIHEVTSGFDKPDTPTLGTLTSVNAIGKPPMSRRHSSSTFSTTKAPPMAYFTETSIYSNLQGNKLETLVEEGFRNRALSEGSALISNDTLNEQQQQQQQQQQMQNATSRYKTELCRPYEESGKCKYGDKCQFAHGRNELRQVVRHPKYKTELCRTYHSSGLCPYGSRCHFIHNQDDPSAMAAQKQVPSLQRSVSVTVPAVTQAQRLNGSNRPSNLQLFPQRGNNRMNNNFSYSPTFVNSPGLESALSFVGVNETGLLSPISPIGKASGQFFNYAKVSPMSPLDISRNLGSAIISERRQVSPPSPPFDFTQGPRNDLDDVVFDTSPTPPDSDRESATGSPPGFGGQSTSCPQRLPIFRCLSQS